MARPGKFNRMQPLAPEGNDRAGELIAVDTLLKGLAYDPREVLPDPLMSKDEMVDEVEKLKDLRYFIAQAWRFVEPATFVNNWHIDAIAEHLKGITDGDILYLLITVPPRHSKSLIISVLWPAWEWTLLPSFRWIFASYSHQLSVRDSRKRRKLIKSDWYRERFGSYININPDQDTKQRFENTKNGFMLATSVDGSNTGEGGERICADDPHNIKEGESEQVRKETVDWWNITMSTRRNDLKTSARLAVQQRTNEGDVAGDIIERAARGLDVIHLNLPTEFMFGGQPACTTRWFIKASGEFHEWKDPRTEPGQLLNPERFGAKDNENAKIELGDYQYAAQHGQQPSPPEGSIIKRDWLRYYGGKNQPPIPDWRKADGFTPLFSLDCTFKDHKDTDFVAGLGFAMFGANIYIMPVRIHKRLGFTDTIDALAEVVGGESLDKKVKYPGIYPFMKIKLVEDKANGSAIIDTLRHTIPGMVPYNPGGASKESRMISASWRFRAGNVYLPDESIATWVVEYRYQLCAFPRAKHDDYVDATSQALLFIGGDPQVHGVPTAEGHKSHWVGINQQELSDRSVWGTDFTGFGDRNSNRSIWRQ